MSKFKSLDKVKCINSKDTDHGLTEGTVYEVDHIDDDWQLLWLINNRGYLAPYFTKRFKLYEELEIQLNTPIYKRKLRKLIV